MIFDEKEKEIIRKAIEDYTFIKQELEDKINKNYTLKELSDFLLKFNGITITNLDEEYGYLDFTYNDIDACIFDALEETVKLKLYSTFRIYNSEKEKYLFDDSLDINDWKYYLTNTKEEELQTMINKLKFLEEKDLQSDYKAQKENIINFLKKYW